MLRRLVQDQWYCTRGDSCIWGLDCNTREQRACDKHPFLPEPPLKISEEKRKLSSSSPLKLPQEPNCSATAECLSCRPPSPSGTWGGHVWRPLSVSVSLCLSLRVMSRVEQLCNDSCTTACAPDSVCAVSTYWSIWSGKICFPPWPEGVQCPLEDDCRSHVGSFSFPFSSHSEAEYQVPRQQDQTMQIQSCLSPNRTCVTKTG